MKKPHTIDDEIRDFAKEFNLPAERVEAFAWVIEYLVKKLPLGVSQWKNHGIKYHYFDFFAEQEQEKGRNEVLQKVAILRQLVSETKMDRDEIYKELDKIAPLFTKKQEKELIMHIRKVDETWEEHDKDPVAGADNED